MKTKQEYIKFTKSILEFLDSIPDDVDFSLIEFIDVYKCDRNIEDFIIKKGYLNPGQARHQDVYSKEELEEKLSEMMNNINSLIETYNKEIEGERSIHKIKYRLERIASLKSEGAEAKTKLENTLAEGPKSYLHVKNPTRVQSREPSFNCYRCTPAFIPSLSCSLTFPTYYDILW